LAGRVLFLSSHVGLGHAARDYAVALALRRLVPRVEVVWCSAEPVVSFLDAVGERVAPECRGLESFSTVIEGLFDGGLGLRGLASSLGILRRNWERMRDLVVGGGFDLVFADEFWEAVYSADPGVKQGIVFGTDFVYKNYSVRPVDFFISLLLNRYFRRVLPGFAELVYMNDVSLVEGKRWYPVIGGRVDEWIARNMHVVGLATSFLKDEVPGREEARRRLGLSPDEYVVLVTVGGTSTRSRQLLGCVDESAQLLAEKLRAATGREARIVALTGPRTSWSPSSSLVEARSGVAPRLLDYYAAADLFISRAGRTTTADLLCLGKPAVLVPIAGHFEQEEIARHMSSRYGYPVVEERRCSPSTLAAAAEKASTLTPEPPGRLCGGSWRTARLLAELLRGAE